MTYVYVCNNRITNSSSQYQRIRYSICKLVNLNLLKRVHNSRANSEEQAAR